MSMFSEVRKRASKAGQPPGTLIYTGEKNTNPPSITVVSYDGSDYQESTSTTLASCQLARKNHGVTWINIEGLYDLNLIQEIAKEFNLHPLTVEDILNVEQRPKVEEFEHYIFATLKVLLWNEKTSTFHTKQFSIVLGEHFVLSFQEIDTTLFDQLQKRLHNDAQQKLRQLGSDYLAYRLIDIVVDQYFVVLEALGDKIEKIEDHLLSAKPQMSRSIYKLKRQILILRKAVWPTREMLSHLVHGDDKFIKSETRLYIRDVYDHTVQAIDTVETFRDMLSSMLDMYLSSLTNRMNEIMKTLTIITTIFIPITAISSFYGMNFIYIPGTHSDHGYLVTFIVMIIIAAIMIAYFKKKRWV